MSIQAALEDLHKDVKKRSLPDLLDRDFVNVSGCESEVTVMQWNVLAQALSGGDDNFVLCPPEALSWENRQLRILEEIYRISPSILCMQEVDCFSFLEKKLKPLGYDGRWVQKPHSPCMEMEGNMGPDGCALFYLKDKLQMMDTQHVNLKENGKATNQTALVCKLKVKDNGHMLYVAVVHLKAKSGFENLRHKQGKYLLDYLMKEARSEPIIVCGDFNASPKEPVYQDFTNSDLELRSVYKTALSEKTEPKYTTWKIRAGTDGKNTESCKTIDYIWIRGNLKLTAILSIPEDASIGPDRLPSYKYPSDHFALACKLVFA
ncbi:nocturnin-like isoform X2 [Ostrea edulis]|nr:nocturnin-like isoform X2 [Ostrea edulis]XP_048756643.2 nocturnin-like isoform X2 [Ostrea edulis]XP_048756644.2 nocturnin-like isoform X2 [Ostrea edulis]